MVDNEEIEYDDMQGIVRFGHGKLREARFLLLNIVNTENARKWLQNTNITTAEKPDQVPDTALQIAFSAQGLAAIELAEEIINDFSDEFIAGMASEQNRSRRLGDIGSNHPENWNWGGDKTHSPHLLLMLYAKNNQLESFRERTINPLFNQAFKIDYELTTSDIGAIEPFGFVDGISQPKIDWKGKVSTDIHQRDSFSNLMSMGELLLGYPNEYGQYTTRPLIKPDTNSNILAAAEEQPNLRDFGKNGSYLVMRQLHQDVRKFWKFMDDEANGDVTEREQLAAAMVGREQDGTPLIPVGKVEIEGIPKTGKRSALNEFNYDDDPLGHQCPLGSHVRRSNPRTGDFPVGVTGWITRLIRTFGFGRKHHGDDLIAATRFHRILRRGRTYGSELTTEKALKTNEDESEQGLHFICLVANISRQFEFVQNAWATGQKFAGLQNETDPLLGNRQPLLSGESTDFFTQPSADGPTKCTSGLPQFVTVVGGGYFFMPGIRAIRYLSLPPQKTSEENND